MLMSCDPFQVRDEIEQLMDDDGDMAEMYLTEKKERMEAAFQKDHAASLGYTAVGVGVSVSAPVSPVCSPTANSRLLERTISLARSSRHGSPSSSESGDEEVQELEMLLEAYFVVIDGTLNKLTSVIPCCSDLVVMCLSTPVQMRSSKHLYLPGVTKTYLGCSGN